MDVGIRIEEYRGVSMPVENIEDFRSLFVFDAMFCEEMRLFGYD